MRAIITVIGKDQVGIIATMSSELAACGANILDISQTTLQEYFAMMMLVDLEKVTMPFVDLVSQLEQTGEKLNMQIHAQHEHVFNAMHRI